MRAASGCLRLMGNMIYCSNQYVIDGDVEQDAQCVEVVDGGKALSGLPLVDGAGFFKSKPVLKVLYRQSFLLAKSNDVLSGCLKVYRREKSLLQGTSPPSKQREN